MRVKSGLGKAVMDRRVSSALDGIWQGGRGYAGQDVTRLGMIGMAVTARTL